MKETKINMKSIARKILIPVAIVAIMIVLSYFLSADSSASFHYNFF